MLSYTETIEGISAGQLVGFFVGFITAISGMILRNYDRQSGT